MRTTKDPADPLCKLVRSQQTVRLDDLAFAVDPLGLYGVQPRTPLGQKTTHHPHSTAALLDAAVVFSDQRLTSLEMCQLAFSQMRTNTFLPRAWSFSQFHSEKLGRYRAHGPAIDESQPRLPVEFRKIEPVAGDGLRIGVLFSDRLLGGASATSSAQLLRGGQSKPAPPAFVLETDGPFGGWPRPLPSVGRAFFRS